MAIDKGSIVRLKSGGPKMTVIHQLMGGAMLCKWFSGIEVKESQFSVESLEEWKEEKE